MMRIKEHDAYITPYNTSTTLSCMPITPFGFKFSHTMTQMNYELIKKMTSKLTQLLVIFVQGVRKVI